MIRLVCVLFVLYVGTVCDAARLDVSVSMDKAGLKCIWGEWPEGLHHVAGWKFKGDLPHHLILYATTSQPTDNCPRAPKNPEIVYVWDGEKTFAYGTDTVRKITPGTRYYLEVHNHNERPLNVRLVSTELLSVPKWQSFIGATALRSGRVWPGETKTLSTPHCAMTGHIQRVRMHAHNAARVQLYIDNQTLLDTQDQQQVNVWYDLDQSNKNGNHVLWASCTYNQDSAIGFTWCNGCKREMCNGFAQLRLPFNVDPKQAICLDKPS